jgi:hypothetical protein
MVERLEAANSLSARWKQAILTAPLTSARASELLTKAEAFLLSNNCQRLVELLVASRTLEVSPDFALLPIMSEGNLPFEEVLSMLLVNPVPIWRTWLPLIGWIIQIANRLPDQVRPEVAKIFELWQTKTPSGIRYRTEVGELAFRWLEDVKDRWGHGSE